MVFQRMLEWGHPPDDWTALVAASRADLPGSLP
jgi:hypothetical protein